MFKTFIGKGSVVIFTLIFTLAVNTGFSQQFFGQTYQQYHEHDEKCFVNLIDQIHIDKFGSIEPKEIFESWMDERIKSKEFDSPIIARQLQEIKVLPVVVHIIHNGEPIGIGPNIPLSQIESQLRILNEDFRRQNPDANLTPAEFLNVAADSKIEFVLAKIDPEGWPTTGIVRVEGPKSTYLPSEIDLFSELSFWPSEDYLNVWVIPLRPPFIGGATFPISNLPGLNFAPRPRTQDGIFIDYRYFGEGGNAAAGSKGRTATHEIGHFLGLRHIWGDVNNCSGTDFVEDTPQQAIATNRCPEPGEPKVSCDSRDMIENYMDYTPDECMNLFTQGQLARMDVVLAESPRRVSLVNNFATIQPDLLPNDLAITRLIRPGDFSCDLILNPEIEIVNAGSNRVTSARVEVRNNGILLEQRNLNLNLNTGERQSIVFNTVNLPPSGNNFEFRIISVNNTADSNPTNNVVNSTPEIQPRASLPYDFEFQDLFSLWQILNPDNSISWEPITLTLDDAETEALFIDNFNYDIPGQQDLLISPGIDLSQIHNAQLTFNLAHAPYTDASLVDNLIVAISTDCGNTFEIAEANYNKNSDFLQTVPPIEDPFFPSSASDFRREIVDLSPYAGQSDVLIAFINRTGWGNNIFIKDIQILTEQVYRYDLELKELISPGPVAISNYEREVISVSNTGNLPITGLVLRRRIGTPNEQSFIARANPLLPGETTNITLPRSSRLGVNEMTYQILFPNFDQNPRENPILRKFVFLGNENVSTPWRLDFDQSTSLQPWSSINPENNLNSWDLFSLSDAPIGTNVARLEFKASGNSQWLASPYFSLARSPQASALFELAAGRVNENAILKVMGSNDGGVSYQEVFRLSGTEISTVDGPSVNPNDQTTFRTHSANLSSLANDSENRQGRLAFVIENHEAGDSPIYINNVELFLSANPEPVIPREGNAILYPNPAREFFNIAFNLPDFEDVNIKIYSSTGALLHNINYIATLNQTYTFSSSNFSKGLFIIQISSPTISETKKLFVH